MSTSKVQSCSQYVNGRDDTGTEWEQLTYMRSMCPMPFLLGLLMGWIIFGVFGLGCYMELFGWELMGLHDNWVGMEWVC